MKKQTNSGNQLKRRKLHNNPVAERMDEVSGILVEQICTAIDEITGEEVFDHEGFRGGIERQGKVKNAMVLVSAKQPISNAHNFRSMGGNGIPSSI